MSKKKPKYNVKPSNYSPKSLLLIGVGIGIFLCLAIFGLDVPLPYMPSISSGAPGGDAALNIIALDVGQGDATLVMTPSHTMLIDCGDRGGEQLMDGYLESYGVTRIDTFIITHPHSDHMGVAPYIIDNYDVGTIILPPIPEALLPTTDLFLDFLDSAEKRGVATRTAEAGDSLDLGSGVTAEVIGPVREDYKDLNDTSVALIIRLGEASFVLTGDAESGAERDMVEAGRLTACDVLFVGHHGSNTSTSKPFLATVAPKAAIISAGADNRYGHPTEEILSRLGEAGAEIYRTDIDGTVHISTDGHTIVITSQNREQNLAA